jgi:hypothetical protein
MTIGLDLAKQAFNYTALLLREPRGGPAEFGQEGKLDVIVREDLARCRTGDGS